MRKLSPYCVTQLHKSLCAMVQTGDCSIDCEGDTVWVCCNFITEVIKHLEDYPWWKRVYLRYTYNKYKKDLNKARRWRETL